MKSIIWRGITTFRKKSHNALKIDLLTVSFCDDSRLLKSYRWMYWYFQSSALYMRATFSSQLAAIQGCTRLTLWQFIVNIVTNIWRKDELHVLRLPSSLNKVRNDKSHQTIRKSNLICYCSAIGLLFVPFILCSFKQRVGQYESCLNVFHVVIQYSLIQIRPISRKLALINGEASASHVQ